MSAALVACSTAAKSRVPARPTVHATRWRSDPVGERGGTVPDAVARDLVKLAAAGIVPRDFDPLAFCTVLVDGQEEGSLPVAVGTCGNPASPTWKLRGVEAIHVAEMEVRPGRPLGLAIEDVLVVPLPRGSADTRQAWEGTATAVHELFHRYQASRAMMVPFEMRERPVDSVLPEVAGDMGTRAYLDSRYSRLPGKAALLLAESAALVDAYDLLEAGRNSGDPAVQFAVKNFLDSRRKRWSLGAVSVGDEEGWETFEGIAGAVTQRALRALGHPDTTLAARVASDRSLLPGATMNSYIYVHGALQAAILDRAVGPDGWTPQVFPGQTGAGLPIGEVFETVMLGRRTVN